MRLRTNMRQKQAQFNLPVQFDLTVRKKEYVGFADAIFTSVLTVNFVTSMNTCCVNDGARNRPSEINSCTFYIF
jgi:hypothetical protein